MRQLKHLASKNLAKGMVLEGSEPQQHVCDACLEGKMHQIPFPKVSERAKRPFDLVHTDLMGPVETVSAVGRNKYVLTLIDDCTRYAWVYFLRRKSQAAERIQRFFAFVETQFDRRIRSLRSDRGGEFLGNSFQDWLDALGVVHNLTLPYTPQQNGVAERYNRTVCDRARSMLFAADLPVRFWEHAVRYANWCTNRLPTSALVDNGIPYTALRERQPDLGMARVFGSMAHVWVRPARKKKPKFTRHSMWGVFLGISPESKGWEFYLPDSGEIGFLSRNALFHEDMFLKQYKAKRAFLEGEEFPSPVVEDDDGFFVDPFPSHLFAPSQEGPSGHGAPEAPMPGDLQATPHTMMAPPVQGESDQLPLVPGVDPLGGGADHPNPPKEPESDDVSVDVPAAGFLLPLPEGALEEGESDDAQEEGESDASDSSSNASSDSSGTNDDVSVQRGLEEAPEPEGRPVRERRPLEVLSPRMKGKSHVFRRVMATHSIPQGLSKARRPALVSQCALSPSHVWRRGGAPPGAAFVVQPAARYQIPVNLKQVDASPFRENWREAILVEKGRLEDLGTWELVDPPPGANILGSKWVFALKQNPDGTLERFKARLVAQGFGQKEGVDYDETFASTAGRATVRLFLAMVCAQGMHLHQMDVSTAFLYGAVDKEIYMKQPPGYEDGSGRVCKLLKSIYGLKQAPRIWANLLKENLLRMGFRVSQLDPSLFILEKDGQVLYLLDFVDDMLLASLSLDLTQWVKDQLSAAFTMKDLGEAEKYVGIHIHRNKETGEMWLHQAMYLLDLAERFDCVQGPFPDTPLPCDFVLFHPWELKDAGDVAPPPDYKGKEDDLLDKEGHKRFQQIVGSLNYVAHTTRVDIAYAVNQLSRVCHCPRLRHLLAAERVVAYLAGTADWGLHFSREGGMYLECYTDANYGHDATKKSVTGLILTCAGGPIYWTSRKQDRITTSTCDAESLAVMTAVQYVEHARDQLAELGCTQMWPTPLFNDNSATIALCCDAVAHKKSVQLTRPMAYVRERTEFGVIQPIHVRTAYQPADFLTKRLSLDLFVKCRSLSGMRPLPLGVQSLSTQGGVSRDGEHPAPALA
jgi:hypothetical protein